MDIRQMRYFIAVAQEGQFTKAAKRLNIAQPPLSQQIKQLEEELDMQLLERCGRHVKLTDAGRIFYLRAEQILNLTGTVKKEIENLRKGLHGTLSIATVISSGAYILPKYIGLFHEKYPKVTFQIFEGDTAHVMGLVDKGIADIGIVRTPFNPGRYACLYQPAGSLSDAMAAAFSKKWDDAFPGGATGLESLRGKPLIIHRRYERMIADACSKLGFEPKILCRSDDIRSMLILAANGLGIAVLPMPSPQLRLDGVRILKIGGESLETKTAFIWLADTCLGAVATNFIDCIKNMSQDAKGLPK